MRREVIFNEGSGDEVRFRVTATHVRREVLVDAPVEVPLEAGHHYRMRFTVDEAEALLALLVEAISAARG